MVKPLTGFLYLTKHKILLVARRLGSYCGGFRSERRFYYWGDTVSRCWCEIRDRAASDAISVEIKWSPERERCFAPKQEVYYWLMNYTIQIDETRDIFLVTIFFNLPTRWSKQEMIAFFSAELDVYTSTECCDSNVTIPMFRNHQIKHNIYVLRYR